MATDLEHDFAAWADHRDTQALTRVFDATAGRLLLLATHVAGPRVTAEDLVQATFMTAMQRCSTWNRRRPVWPWLGTILQNQARMEWRRERRRREVGIDEATLLSVEGPDPAALAASDDAFDAIVLAIDALPLEYRQVLRLRLVHGLAHGEIARALEVPVGTVRARTHRGIARLRQALPSRVCTGFLGALFASEGALLAQVRAGLLAAAESSKAATMTGAIPPAMIAGVLTMKGKTILFSAACVALLVLGALWALSGVGSGEPGDSAASLTAELREGQDLPQTREEVQDPKRKVLDANGGPAWPLVGLVQTYDHQPIPGARVEVSVAPPNIALLPEPDSLREVLTVCESDDEGKFECDLDALQTRSRLFRAMTYLFVEAAHSGFGSKFRILRLPMKTDPKQFSVELKLSPRYGIVGRVVDAGGALVPGAVLWSVSENGTWVSRQEAVTDDEGRFRMHIPPDQLGSAAAYVMAAQQPHGIGWIPLPTFAEPPSLSAPIDVGTIRLAKHASLRGRVVLGDGTGLGDFPLVVYRIPPEAPDDPKQVRRVYFDLHQQRQPIRFTSGHPVYDRVKTRTSADGSFAVRGLRPDTAYAVSVRTTSMRPITATGRTDAEPIRLAVDAQLLLVDVRDESGGSLPGAKISAWGFDPELDVPADRILSGFPAKGLRVKARFYPGDAKGRRMLLLPFGWTWRIGPFDEAARPDFIRHDVMAGMHRAQVSVVLQPQEAFGSLQIEIVDEKGKPFEPFDVALRSLGGDVSRSIKSRNLEAGGLIPKLPAGRWRVTVNAGKHPERNPTLSMIQITARGSYQREVRVKANETSVVRIEVVPAGLVGFRLQRDSPALSGGWREVVLRHESDSRVLSFAILEDQLGRFLGAPDPAMHPGRGLIVAREPLTPGRHRFSIEVEGYLPARCEATVEVDRLVEVSVRLHQR